MRVLNDEEIAKDVFPDSPDFSDVSWEYEKHFMKAQLKQDIKDFIEDLVYHGEADDESWKTAESFILPMWYLRDLKQLAEGRIEEE